jgi:hypothetical protein
MCEQQYFLEYVLGWRGPSNQKADKGTIVHKVLEILAFIKQGQQNNLSLITDDIAGEIKLLILFMIIILKPTAIINGLTRTELTVIIGFRKQFHSITECSIQEIEI